MSPSISGYDMTTDTLPVTMKLHNKKFAPRISHYQLIIGWRVVAGPLTPSVMTES